jgi:hypothetical protein
MKVLVQGKEYRLWFKHLLLHGEKYRGMTSCCIIDQEKGTAVSYGHSACVIPDIFVKATGRKLALARAVQPFSREDRREIWKQYFDNIHPKKNLDDPKLWEGIGSLEGNK